MKFKIISAVRIQFALFYFLLLVPISMAKKLPLGPTVNENHSITFTLNAPSATRVELYMDGGRNALLKKRKDGTWTYTTAPLPPDWYGYSLNVDGLTINDPANPITTPNLIYIGNQVLVPGDPAEPWEVQNVPHGTLHHHFYHSEIIGDNRDYYVYTPPGFHADSKHPLPTLYLFHGYSDIAGAWTQVGKANVIFDNLLAAGKIKPMVVVMTLGYGVPGFASPGSKAFSDSTLRDKNFSQFEAALLKEVMPAVETEYKVSKKSSERAVSGLSMGGSETFLVGLHNPDKFHYVGAYSAGGLPIEMESYFPGLNNDHHQDVFIACGTDDGLITWNRAMEAWLKTKGFDPTVVEVPGGHQWQLWRRFLIQFSETLFRK